nr:hypothetical protein [Tanacetum cinerariifolium]
NEFIGVQGNGNQNQIGNGNLVAARAEGNAAGQNGNQIRCYNYRGVDLDEIEEVNANRILMANLQQASTLAKFVGDFKYLANEADASLAKHEALELEIERLLKAVVRQDIMIIMQNESVVDTSDLQTELERTKECFENCIIKRENEYAKLWNDWYKKCDECKYDKISYDKAYKDMQQKIECLQAQLGDLKGKSKDTSCVSDTRNPLSQKLKNENVELEFQDSDQKDNTHDTSENTKFAKQPIVENIPKVGETNALSKPVTSNSVSTPQESKGVNNDKVIAPGMFRINPFKTSRDEKHVPNTVRASDKKKPITVSHPPVIIKNDVSSDVNGLSSTGADNTKTRRPQPRSKRNHDRVPSASKSSRSKNKEAEVEEHHMNLLLSKNNKHISSACNDIKIYSQDVISKVVCVMCKKCLISVNHDECLRNYVNGKNSRGRKHKANVYFKENQMKYQPKVTKPKKVGFLERLATPKPRKPRFLLRWSPTGRLFDQKGNIVDSSESESQPDCSNGDNACTSNTLEPKIKRFLNSTSLLDRLFRFVMQNGVVERRNRTLVEAARTMLIFSRAPLFLWAEAIATACFTQNRSIIHHIGKLGAKGDIGFFIGYSADSCAYGIYNRRTKKIMETMNVSFDELSAMAFEQRSSKPGLQSINSGQISLGLDLTYAPSTITMQQPSKGELDLLFEAMYDDYIGG